MPLITSKRARVLALHLALPGRWPAPALGMRHSRAGTAVAQALRLRSATLRFFALDTAISFPPRRGSGAQTSKRGASIFCAGHGNLFTSHPPYDAGDLRRGYRRLVPCRLFWLWTGRRAGLLVKPPPVPLSALELLSSTITSSAPGFAKPHQCRCISEILRVVARSATLAVSRLFRDLVTASATTVSWDVTSCCATVSSCCCPATWGPCCGPCSCGSRLFTLTTLHCAETHCSVSLSGLVLSSAPP